jgi:hypothetical protein
MRANLWWTGVLYICALMGVMGCLLSALGLALVAWVRTSRTAPGGRPHAGEVGRAKLLADDSTDDPFIHKSRTERRASLRRKGIPIEVVLRDARGRLNQGTGWVTDRSLGGLCLVVSKPVQVGACLQVRSVQAPGTVPWVGMEIMRCLEKNGRWVLGCRFLQQPAWNVLMLFG